MRADLQRLFFVSWLLPAVIVCCLPLSATAQESQEPKDSTSLYKKLKDFADKRKVTKFLYGCFFRDPYAGPPPSLNNSRSKSNGKKNKDPNAKYAGRIIKNIDIQVYDPFGHSVNDTVTRPVTGLQNLGNKAHIKTQTGIVRNILLFKKNEKIDLLKITESERMLRQAVFINDARIYVAPVGRSKDSVEVKVFVHDRWSLDVWVEMYDLTEVGVTFGEYNLGGLGQQLTQYVTNDFLENEPSSETRYSINNIGRTYISSSVFYRTGSMNHDLGFTVNRPFYSPLTRWAGGIVVSRMWRSYHYWGEDSSLQQTPLNYYYTDYWLGKSFHPFGKNSIDNRSRNIVIAVRYVNTHYLSRPSFEVDTGRLFRHSALYIGSVSYSVRKFYKDQYIYRFGANEDISEGWLLQGLYGVQDREEHKFRYYAGFEISRGRRFGKFGYLFGSFIYGNYFNKEVKNNATINTSLFYFSNLLEVGRWRVRQFVHYRLVYGFNKPQDERLGLDPLEMYGFVSDSIRGTRKMVLNLESVLYTPYNIIGFRFAPVFLLAFGMIDQDREKFFDTRIYQAYAIGILFRNENLLINTFRFTVGAYPVITTQGQKHFKINPSVSFSLRIRGLTVGRPTPVIYQ